MKKIKEQIKINKVIFIKTNTTQHKTTKTFDFNLNKPKKKKKHKTQNQKIKKQKTKHNTKKQNQPTSSLTTMPEVKLTGDADETCSVGELLACGDTHRRI